MQTLMTIDSLALANIHGGQETSGGIKVTTPTVGVEANGKTEGVPERKTPFVTCMNDMGGGGGRGWFERQRTYNDRYGKARSACRGLKGSPENPDN
jgi:hypothetical protein